MVRAGAVSRRGLIGARAQQGAIDLADRPRHGGGQ
jgi:hypothetical protein